MALMLLLLTYLLLGTALATPHTRRATEIVPFSSIGDVGAVADIHENTRLFYQQSDGSIWQYVVNGEFSTGTNGGQVQIVPPEEARPGTPIATTIAVDTDLREMHVFFFSRQNVVSEYMWKNGAFVGGANCAECITVQGFVATRNSFLYALENLSRPSLRVGFVSAGSPSTVTEAESSDDGRWQLAVFPPN